ncbi:regulatory protein weta [Naviculisporaceae sp. PSN 640]
MASSVHGMAFTAGDHVLLENKENETFSWQDMADESNSGDFFEQYVMLDGTDAGSPTTGGGENSSSFNELGEVHDMAAFSPLVPPPNDAGPSSLKQEPAGTGTSSVNQSGSSSHGVSGYTNQAFAPKQHGQSHPNRQIRARADMLHLRHHNTMEQNDHFASSYELSGGGSISDSELLKLEGLTMRSPRVNLPPTSASVPPSPHSQSTSPKKGGRLEAIYARIRNKAATFQGKTRQQPQSAAVDMQPPTISTASMGSPPSNGKAKPYNLQINKEHLPISPPLTGSMTDLSHQPGAVPVTSANSASTNVNSMQFVNGFLEDPFFDPSSLLAAMPQTNGSGVGQNTPLHTPLLNTFTTSSAGGIPSQAAHVWQLGPDGKTLWSPASIDDPNSTTTATDNTWWNDSDAMDTDPLGDVNTTTLFQPQHRNMNNAALNLAMQQLQQQQSNNQNPQQNGNGGAGGFEYPLPPGTADEFAASGLMIHMPQPRTPAAAVLDPSYYPQNQNGEQKRPKPRAPSSGARYHHHHPSGAMTSPRKTRATSGSGGPGAVNGGRTTPSPSPTPGEGGPSRRLLHRRSASMNTLNGGIPAGAESLGPTNPNAIRKRKSWTGRRLGATEAAAAAAALHHPHQQAHPQLHSVKGSSSSSSRRQNKRPSHDRKHSTGSSSASNANGNSKNGGGSSAAGNSGGGGGLGFVNFTPNDHNIIMTGVAPSGSSKTKARREKEAAERQRRLSEAVVKAVAAAGGDLKKLEQEGIDCTLLGQT